MEKGCESHFCEWPCYTFSEFLSNRLAHERMVVKNAAPTQVLFPGKKTNPYKMQAASWLKESYNSNSGLHSCVAWGLGAKKENT